MATSRGDWEDIFPMTDSERALIERTMPRRLHDGPQAPDKPYIRRVPKTDRMGNVHLAPVITDIEAYYRACQPQADEPDCGTCRDRGALKANNADGLKIIRCPDCEPQRTIADQLADCGIERAPAEWHPLSWLLPAKVACDELLGGDRWCVVLRGGPGRGKTVLAEWTARQWIERDIGLPMLVQAGELLNRLRDTQAEDSNERLTSVITAAERASLLVIDDLGKHTYTEFAQAQFYAIIDARYRKSAPLIITTNMRPSEDKLNEATRSRIAVGEVIIRGGRDMRVSGRE